MLKIVAATLKAMHLGWEAVMLSFWFSHLDLSICWDWKHIIDLGNSSWQEESHHKLHSVLQLLWSFRSHHENHRKFEHLYFHDTGQCSLQKRTITFGSCKTATEWAVCWGYFCWFTVFIHIHVCIWLHAQRNLNVEFYWRLLWTTLSLVACLNWAMKTFWEQTNPEYNSWSVGEVVCCV